MEGGGGEDDIGGMREQLRRVQGKVERLRRVGAEQMRSLACVMPDIEPVIDLSLKVSDDDDDDDVP
jgi:hypothetical protein